MVGIQDSKWDGFQSTFLKKVAKVIAISYLRESERRETEVSAKTGGLENSNYKFSLFFFKMRKMWDCI